MQKAGLHVNTLYNWKARHHGRVHRQHGSRPGRHGYRLTIEPIPQTREEARTRNCSRPSRAARSSYPLSLFSIWFPCPLFTPGFNLIGPSLQSGSDGKPPLRAGTQPTDAAAWRRRPSPLVPYGLAGRTAKFGRRASPQGKQPRKDRPPATRSCLQGNILAAYGLFFDPPFLWPERALQKLNSLRYTVQFARRRSDGRLCRTGAPPP